MQILNDRGTIEWLLTTRIFDIGGLLIGVTTIIVNIKNSMRFITEELKEIKAILHDHSKNIAELQTTTETTKRVQDLCPYCQRTKG